MRNMKRHFLPILLIVITSMAIYSNSLNNGFVYDDENTIVKNVLIKSFWNLPKLFEADYFSLSAERSYRPVVTFTYFLDYAIYGLRPWGCHLTNIMLHAANGALLYIFLILLSKHDVNRTMVEVIQPLSNKPLLTTLLFVTNPVLTEAVNAISFREDLLVFFFYIAALNIYTFLRSNRGQSLSYLLYALSCLLYFMALFSKEMAITLPLIVYCYEWFFKDKSKAKESSFLLNRYNMGYIAITLIYLYIRFYYFSNPVEENLLSAEFTDRILTLPLLVISYLKLCLFPIFLSPDYKMALIKSIHSLSFIFPAIALTFIIAGLLILLPRYRKSEIYFAALFFIITLSPVYNLFPITNPMAERYLYLPAMGFAIVLSLIIYFIYDIARFRMKKYSRYIIILFIAIVGLYSITVVKRNNIWRDNFSLWSDTVKKMSKSNMAHYNLARAYAERGKLNEAVLHYRAAMQLESNPDTFNNLGVVYNKMGRFKDAILQFKSAISLNPTEPTYHYNLANAFKGIGDFNEAIQEYRNAIILRPDFIDADIQLKIISILKKEQDNVSSKKKKEAL